VSRARAVELIQRGRRFLLTCHVRPDGDALGSMLGLASILRALGKEVVMYNSDPVPSYLTFLPGADQVLRALPPDAAFDATFVTDTASRSLLPAGLPPPDRSGPLVVIDHHAAHDGFGDVPVREVDAVATGEVVLRLMRDLGVARVPADAATPLYTAIVTDTGGFRYQGTSAETMRLGAELIEAGAEPWTVAYNVFEGWAPERLRLLGAVLETLRTECEGRVATLLVTREMLGRLGADDDMVEGLVNYARMLRGVEIAALVWEWHPRDGAPQVKLSLRSRGRADVSRVAVALGGGGHRAAAGATLAGDVDRARARVVAEAAREIARLDAGGG
jgi:phosphoesterase RecJ-like protein